MVAKTIEDLAAQEALCVLAQGEDAVSQVRPRQDRACRCKRSKGSRLPE